MNNEEQIVGCSHETLPDKRGGSERADNGPETADDLTKTDRCRRMTEAGHVDYSTKYRNMNDKLDGTGFISLVHNKFPPL